MTIVKFTQNVFHVHVNMSLIQFLPHQDSNIFLVGSTSMKDLDYESPKTKRRQGGQGEGEKRQWRDREKCKDG